MKISYKWFTAEMALFLSSHAIILSEDWNAEGMAYGQDSHSSQPYPAFGAVVQWSLC